MNTFDTFVQIYNPNLGYLAFGYNDSANYTQSLEIINNKSNQKILSNGTINVDNITIYSIYFESIDDSNVSTNRSIFSLISMAIHLKFLWLDLTMMMIVIKLLML